MAIIAIGADHAGFSLKEQLKAWLAPGGHRGIDHGTHSPAPLHYPHYAAALARARGAGGARRGGLLCGPRLRPGPAAHKGGGGRARGGGRPARAARGQALAARRAPEGAPCVGSLRSIPTSRRLSARRLSARTATSS